MSIEKMDQGSPKNESQEKFEGGTPPQESVEELSTPEQVVSLMSSSKSEKEWNSNCDKVTAAFKGYPDWWYEKIVISRIAAKTQASWGK